MYVLNIQCRYTHYTNLGVLHEIKSSFRLFDMTWLICSTNYCILLLNGNFSFISFPFVFFYCQCPEEETWLQKCLSFYERQLFHTYDLHYLLALIYFKLHANFLLYIKRVQLSYYRKYTKINMYTSSKL